MNKRTRESVFAAIDALDAEDAKAKKKQRSSTKREISKSKAAHSQLKVYEKLMEIRIMLQRVLQQPKVNKDDEGINQLLDQLLKAQSIFFRKESPSKQDDDDDSSQNDTDDDSNQSTYQQQEEEWKEVLNRRYKDLRLQSGLSATSSSKFKVVDSSFWEQVEAATQHELAANVGNGDDNLGFDDSKLYQHLLQDFLTGKNQQQSIVEQRRAVSKTKQQVDRKASKGRKLRYQVHPKLVNFTFPVSRPEPPGMDENAYFKSLFRGNR